MSMRLLEAVARNPNMWGAENNLMIGYSFTMSTISASTAAGATQTIAPIPVFTGLPDARSAATQFQLTLSRQTANIGYTLGWNAGIFGSNTPIQIMLSVANGAQASAAFLTAFVSGINSTGLVMYPMIISGTGAAVLSHITQASCSCTIWLKGNALGQGIPT